MKRLRPLAPLLLVFALVAVLGRQTLLSSPPPLDEGEVLTCYIRRCPVKLLVEDRYDLPNAPADRGDRKAISFLVSKAGVPEGLVERMWTIPQDGFPQRVVAECHTVTSEELAGFRRTTDFYGGLFRAHPGTQAIAWLSRPVMSSDGLTAIFFARIYSDGLTGWSGMVVMKRVDGKWKLSTEAHLPTYF